MNNAIQQLNPQNQTIPINENCNTLRRRSNAEYRSREYLTPDEIKRLIKAVRKHNSQAHRNEAIILLSFRHALRANELTQLKWDQFNTKDQTLYVKRLKRGRPSTHPMETDELRLVGKLRAKAQGRYVFMSRRGTPLSYSSVRHIVRSAGCNAGIDFPIHPHMLRHACGYALVNKGVDIRIIQQWMGHASIQHTVRYTELDASRFDGMGLSTRPGVAVCPVRGAMP